MLSPSYLFVKRPLPVSPDGPQPGRYRHYKEKDYLVLGVARHSETEEEFVPEELVASVPNRYNKKRAGQIQIRAPLAFTFVPGEAASSGFTRPDLQQGGPPSFGTAD